MEGVFRLQLGYAIERMLSADYPCADSIHTIVTLRCQTNILESSLSYSVHTLQWQRTGALTID
jgi:hypothetical protein